MHYGRIEIPKDIQKANLDVMEIDQNVQNWFSQFFQNV